MPFKTGKTLTGFGVVRLAPWFFVGIYPTKAEATIKAEEMGPEYEVHWGENQDGTDNFVWTSAGHSDAART